jgi:hypothetical protein
MKKFYLLIMAFVCYATTTNAQILTPATCPSTLAIANYIVSLQPPFYQLWITGGPTTAGTGSVPPASVQLLDINGAAIPIFTNNGTTPISYLNNNGSATINYGGQFVDIVQIIWRDPVSGNLKTCQFRPGPAASLPIKLSSFSGRLNTETEATIAWSSSLEENSFKYEVQRSADGKNFVTVGTVNAAGTSLQTVKYSYNDALPGAGAYFYRLKMIDQDGKSEMSKTVYVNSKKGAGVVTKVFPNPFTSEIQLIGATSADLNSSNTIQVFTVTGQRVNFRITGANAIAIDENSPRGVYILKIKDQTFKLNKQ